MQVAYPCVQQYAWTVWISLVEVEVHNNVSIVSNKLAFDTV
jgi:hypothetical protein